MTGRGLVLRGSEAEHAPLLAGVLYTLESLGQVIDAAEIITNHFGDGGGDYTRPSLLIVLLGQEVPHKLMADLLCGLHTTRRRRGLATWYCIPQGLDVQSRYGFEVAQITTGLPTIDLSTAPKDLEDAEIDADDLNAVYWLTNPQGIPQYTPDTPTGALTDTKGDANGLEWQGGLWRDTQDVSPETQISRVEQLRDLGGSLSDVEPNAAGAVPVVDGLAYREQFGVLHGAAFSGKSTLAGHAAAAASQGRIFCGQQLARETILYVGLEESPAIGRQRLLHADADPERVLYYPRLNNPAQDLAALVEVHAPTWIIIDSLTALGAAWVPRVEDWANSAQVSKVVNYLADLAHSGPAVTLLHHNVKTGDTYRDSSAIGAAADFLIGIQPGNDPQSRVVSGIGRLPIPSLHLTLTPQGFTASSDNIKSEEDPTDNDLETTIIAYVAGHAGCSGNAVDDGIPGNRLKILKLISQLVYAERLTRTGGGLYVK